MLYHAGMLKEFRCTACKKLLFKGVVVTSIIELKCRSCGEMNTFEGEENEELLCLKGFCPGRVTSLRTQKEEKVG